MRAPRIDLEQAAVAVAHAGTPRPQWNPLYRALAPASLPTAPPPAPAPAPLPRAAQGALEGSTEETVQRQFTARALLVVAVTDGGSTWRLRIGLQAEGATWESSCDEEPSLWSSGALREVPGLIADLLSEAGVDPDAPQLSVRRDADGLRLTPDQIEHVRADLAQGDSPAGAFATAPDLDERLLDALTASGPRIAVSLTLFDPSGKLLERSENWSRMWVRGTCGLYRMDASEALFGVVHPVDDGDIPGTLLPILEEGVRFVAACSATGSAR